MVTSTTKAKRLYGRLRIAYHGTPNKRTADRILRVGFPEGTFFANHLEDAIGMGGPWVFTVVVPHDFFNTARGRNAWEAVNAAHIWPSWIQSLTFYRQRQEMERPELTDLVFESNQ